MRKQQPKKLALHRETVRRLDAKELILVNGGEDLPTCGFMDSGCTSCLGTANCSGE